MAKQCKVCGNEFYMDEYRDSIGSKEYRGWCKVCGTMFIRSQNNSTKQWSEYWKIPKLADKPEAGGQKTLKTVEHHEPQLNEPEQACFISHVSGSLPCDGDIDKKADEEYPMSKKFKPMMSDSDWLAEKQQEAFYEGAKWMKSCVGGNDR